MSIKAQSDVCQIGLKNILMEADYEKPELGLNHLYAQTNNPKKNSENVNEYIGINKMVMEYDGHDLVTVGKKSQKKESWHGATSNSASYVYELKDKRDGGYHDDEYESPSKQLKVMSPTETARIRDITINGHVNAMNIVLSMVATAASGTAAFMGTISTIQSLMASSSMTTTAMALGIMGVGSLGLYVDMKLSFNDGLFYLQNHMQLRPLLKNNNLVDANHTPALKLLKEFDAKWVSSSTLAKLVSQHGLEREQAIQMATVILNRGKSHLKYFDVYQRAFSFSQNEISEMLNSTTSNVYKNIVETRYFGENSEFNNQPALLNDQSQPEQSQILPPHITPEQVARVRENLAQLDITSQVAAALNTNSVSAAHKVGEAEINEISRILSTINTDSQSTLDIAKGLIERLTPISTTITRSQKDIALLRDNSLWGLARRAFNRLTVHRFAANVTANFNEIDRDVAESRATSISLMERFETLGSLGQLLDEPLRKINDTIESSLQETPASPEVETVLRATQKHALTLNALSQQAQQMVGMLVTSESNFATFTRGIGIANVATGLAQTVNDMAEKNRMTTGLTAPMNEQIATSVLLFETRLMEVQAQIAAHTAEFEKGAQLAREFQTNVMLSLPAPEQDLGNPLDQLTTQPHKALVGTTRHMILD